MSKYISYIFQIFLSSKKTRNEKFQNKKEIPLFQLHYATDRAHNEPLGLFSVFWPSTRVQ